MPDFQISTDNPTDIAIIALAKTAASVGRENHIAIRDIPTAVDKLAFTAYLLIRDDDKDFGSTDEWKILVVHLRRLIQEIETTIIQPGKPTRNL